MFFRYEHTWFDRAHNKLIDVLVMNGLLGLMAYLVLWGLVFYFILKTPKSRNNAKPYAAQRGNEPLERAALLFFGAAYFTQNLFVFENISVYIPFFAFLGFLASRGTRISADNKLISADNKLISADDQKLITADANQRKSAINQRKSVLLAAAASIAALFFAAALAATLIAFGQMRAYTIPFLAGRADQIVANFDRIAKPYTYIQPELRSLFSQTIFGGLAEENINAIRPFLTMAAEAMKEAAERERTSARYFLFTASAYGALGDLEQAKKHQRRALELAPRRQDVLYAIALSGAKAGNKETALYYAEKMRGLDPEAMISRIHYAVVLALTQGAASFKESAGLMLSVFEGPRPFRQVSGEISVARQVFDFYIMEFYLARDSEQFLKALQKLKLFEERYDVSVRFHSPDAPPSEQIPKIQRRIDVFIAEGWEGVQF
jgi:tetratricopeptide (TPR) repeat protein